MIKKLAALSILSFGAGVLFMGLWAIDFMPTTTISEMTPDIWVQTTTMVFMPIMCGLFFIMVGVFYTK